MRHCPNGTVVKGILDSMSCISHFKAQASGFHSKSLMDTRLIPQAKFPRFWIPLHGAKLAMRYALISSTLQRAFIPLTTLAHLWQNGTFCRTGLFKLPLILGQYSGQMYFSKGNFFENPGIMATTLTDKIHNSWTTKITATLACRAGVFYVF